MSAAGGSGRVWAVVCPDWSTKPMSRAAAEKWCADVERTGACGHEHEIVRAVES